MSRLGKCPASSSGTSAKPVLPVPDNLRRVMAVQTAKMPALYLDDWATPRRQQARGLAQRRIPTRDQRQI
ncbi:MAG: hypothetical protein WBM40_17205 [Thiohalocapsa sp.]